MIPTRSWVTPRRLCGPSRRRSRRCADRTRTFRWRSCCTGSTRCCGAGRRTSGPGCPQRPSSTCPRSPGGRSSGGCTANTAGPHGKSCAAATARAAGGPPTARWSCSRGAGVHHPLPLPRNQDPLSLAQHHDDRPSRLTSSPSVASSDRPGPPSAGTPDPHNGHDQHINPRDL
jgi:hypothetical protein